MSSAGFSDSAAPPSNDAITHFELVQRVATARAEVKRRQYLANPRLWALERLGTTLWSKQIDIMRSVRDNRKTAVKSCHQIGKSFTGATVAAWWLDTHPPGSAFVVTSAPTTSQVKAILWREINRAHGRGKLAGRTTQDQWRMTTVDAADALVAYGRKPGDLDLGAFQGIHDKFTLVIFDEACGMPHPLWIASDSLIANDTSRRLDQGNPDDPNTHFKKVCDPGSGWNVISVGAFETPNFTGEAVPPAVSEVLIGKTYVEECRRMWAPNWNWNKAGTAVVPPRDADGNIDKVLATADPYWQSKILGEFPPTGGPLALIPDYWVMAACESDLQPGRPLEFGVDVGAGGDSSTIAFRQGGFVNIVHDDKNPNTMETCANIIAKRNALGGKSIVVKVDKIGIGAGVVDRANELGEGFIGVNVGQSASPEEDEVKGSEELFEKGKEKYVERFANLRAKNWWFVRSMFESGQVRIDPSDKDLVAELKSIRYERRSNGKILIESKRDAAKRGIASPNRADALMLALAPAPTQEPPEREKFWGLVF